MNKDIDIPKNQGFKTPEDYFENMQTHLDTRIALEQHLGVEKNLGFEVPPSYFENNDSLYYNIIEGTEAQQVKNTRNFRLSPRVLYVSLATAAALLLLLVLKPFAQKSIDIYNVDALTVENYLEDVNLENIEYDLELMLATENNGLLLDGLKTNEDNILNYLQQETDLMDLNLD